MLDIRVIRENPEEVKARLKPRSGDAWKLVDDVLACDEARRNAETEKQALQSERNATSKQIGMLKKKGEDTSSIEARVREIGDRIRELDRVAEENAAQLTSLLMNIPNLPHLECPVGADETANPEIKLWGEKPAIENPKDHVELAANLGMISFEDGARITGSGFVVYRGAGARLERALINFLLNTQTVENGYQEVGVPFVVIEDDGADLRIICGSFDCTGIGYGSYREAGVVFGDCSDNRNDGYLRRLGFGTRTYLIRKVDCRGRKFEEGAGLSDSFAVKKRKRHREQ